jgi:outer membrane protein OmpA-like peptidoglycan-associated protein
MVRNKIGANAVVGAACAAVLGTIPGLARADGFSVKLEPGVSIPLSSPQSSVYDVGGSESLKALFGITPYLDLGPTASFTLLPASVDGRESGVVWGLGGGARLKGPRDADSSRFSPWADADLFFVRSGDLNRPGFDLAAGLAIAVGDERSYWVGPFVRYMQVIQPARDGYDNRDAKILTLGLSVEFGEGIERPVVATQEAVTLAPEPSHEVVREVAVCPDGDKDGVPDSVDRCLQAVGGPDNWGCPAYKKVLIKRDKLELKENIYFAWNSAEIDAESHPVLDEVVQALQDNKAFRVQLDGHADSSGNDDRNQTLSEKRADAVRDYLIAHGVEKERLVSKGFSSSVPAGDNKTASGRGDNRRVEFVVYFIILNDGDNRE